MDATTITCEQCGQQAARGLATYSAAGQLACPACAAKELLASNSDRAAASRRSVRILAVVSVALLVGPPSLMIAAGAGKYVATGLIILGVILLVGGRQAHRMGGGDRGDPGVRRGALFVMLAGVAAVIAGVALQGVLRP